MNEPNIIAAIKLFLHSLPRKAGHPCTAGFLFSKKQPLHRWKCILYLPCRESVSMVVSASPVEFR